MRYAFPKTDAGTWALPVNPYDDPAGRKYAGGELRNSVAGSLHFSQSSNLPLPEFATFLRAFWSENPHRFPLNDKDVVVVLPTSRSENAIF